MSKQVEINRFKNIWSMCQRCPLSKLRSQLVFGTGNLDADLVFIGEAPGKEEDEAGQPFVSLAGEKFNALLQAVGIKRDDIWITNTCICRPKSDKPGKDNRAPTVEEIRACNGRLYEELDIVKPRIIVLGGNIPLYMATGKRGITKHRGWQDVKWRGTDFEVSKVFATLHPASLLYGSTEQLKLKRQWMYEDWLAIAKEMLSVTTQKSGR